MVVSREKGNRKSPVKVKRCSTRVVLHATAIVRYKERNEMKAGGERMDICPVEFSFRIGARHAK